MLQTPKASFESMGKAILKLSKEHPSDDAAEDSAVPSIESSQPSVTSVTSPRSGETYDALQTLLVRVYEPTQQCVQLGRAGDATVTQGFDGPAVGI